MVLSPTPATNNTRLAWRPLLCKKNVQHSCRIFGAKNPLKLPYGVRKIEGKQNMRNETWRFRLRYTEIGSTADRTSLYVQRMIILAHNFTSFHIALYLLYGKRAL